MGMDFPGNWQQRLAQNSGVKTFDKQTFPFFFRIDRTHFRISIDSDHFEQFSKENELTFWKNIFFPPRRIVCCLFSIFSSRQFEWWPYNNCRLPYSLRIRSDLQMRQVGSPLKWFFFSWQESSAGRPEGKSEKCQNVWICRTPRVG